MVMDLDPDKDDGFSSLFSVISCPITTPEHQSHRKNSIFFGLTTVQHFSPPKTRDRLSSLTILSGIKQPSPPKHINPTSACGRTSPTLKESTAKQFANGSHTLQWRLGKLMGSVRVKKLQ
ncbi:hypothetical protein TNCV_1423811 [Trichonephila clavipes]|nr:hypothetical protein TNCV_1423811 [Trichonephila clavipes]